MASARILTTVVARRVAAPSFARSGARFYSSSRSAESIIGPVDWTRMGRRLGRNTLMYLPGLTLFFGWPFMAKSVLDGNMGKL